MPTQSTLPRLAIGALLVASGTRAEDGSAIPAQAASAMLLPEVVVTASRYEEDIATVPASVSVITKGDIADSTAKDVPGILQEEAGLHVYDITGNGRSYRVDRSGFGETANLNTLVLVDGRRLNNPDLAGPDWTLVPLERVERIEVVRGSRGSVLYGDNATDGVINIITQKGGEGLRLGAEGAGGSYGTLRSSAYASGAYEDLSYALAGRYYESDGYRENSDTEQTDVGLSLDYAFGSSGRLGLSAGFHEDDTGLPGALRQSDLQAGLDRRDSTNPLDFANTDDNYVQLIPEVFFLENSRFKAPVSYRKREQEFFSSFAGGEFRGDTDIDYLTASPQVVLGEPIGGLDNTLTIGFDYYAAEEDIRNESEFFGTLDVGEFDLEKRNSGIFLYDELYLTERLSLSAGHRWDQVRYDFSPTAPDTSDEADYDERVFTAGTTFRFLDQSYAYLNFAEGFRYPVLDELFSFFTNTLNPDLQPQTSDNLEIGVRHHFTSELYADLNLFRLDTSDEIFFNPSTFDNENFDAETRREGLELTAGYGTKKLGIEATYSYRDSEIRGGLYAGNQVPNVPRHQASLEVVWRPLEPLSLALRGIYVGDRYLESDYENAFEKQDDYLVFNLKLKYRLQKLTAFLDLNNLFDEEYSAYGVLSTLPVEPAYYPSPERNLMVGLRYDY